MEPEKGSGLFFSRFMNRPGKLALEKET